MGVEIKNNTKMYKFWFITGSQNLYGSETLAKVEIHSRKIAEAFECDPVICGNVEFKGVVKSAGEIEDICLKANSDKECIGVITWMHTFSPSQMWIPGLSILNKPLLHLHTQYNREIPWDSIDMDFMNLNQSAHGDREHGFIGARLRIPRKIIAGYWEDFKIKTRIDSWMRSAIGVHEFKNLKVARFGDNMREVAVTEGDKIEARIKFGVGVSGYGIGDLISAINNVKKEDTDNLMMVYKEKYGFKYTDVLSVRVQAEIEAGMRSFLSAGGFKAFTTTFENLYGLKQLPGLAVQRLMQDGYGFGAEGDWKTAALVRVLKVMAEGLSGGTSFMEDYTYHLEAGNELILGAHMLEVCPSIAATKPIIEVHPLGIGGKEAPARMVFDGAEGSAILVSLIDMGGRFRFIINDALAKTPIKNMPKLPVARVMWKPMPDLVTSAEAWIMAGGAHHSVLSYALDAQHIKDMAETLKIECIHIGKHTNIEELSRELKYNDIIWR